MQRRALVLSATVLTAIALVGCGDTAGLSVEAGMGPHPSLPPPRAGLIPTIKVADARPWPAGETPTPAPGLRVAAFASGLDHPRWLYVLPNGDVLVAETNAPPKPKDGKGLRGFFMGLAMKKAGAAAPTANRISLLRDADGDGVAETRTVLLSGLNSPFGMTLVGDTLYVANADALVRFPYRAGDTRITATGVRVADLPGGPINHHWTKNVVAGPDGTLYVSVGSNSNAGENGLDKEVGRAAIWAIDPATGAHRIFAGGLRNPVGMAWNPDTGALWVAVNERDEIGSDLVPDYMTSVKDGGFYGWPYSYYGQNVDSRVSPQRPDLVARALAPDYALGPHTASLGLSFSVGADLGQRYANGAFVGQHGSWNRNPRSGYKVIFVPFSGGAPVGPAVDVLTGFLTDSGEARGRPVGVAIVRRGALPVADDVGNVIWRVTRTGG